MKLSDFRLQIDLLSSSSDSSADNSRTGPCKPETSSLEPAWKQSSEGAKDLVKTSTRLSSTFARALATNFGEQSKTINNLFCSGGGGLYIYVWRLPLISSSLFTFQGPVSGKSRKLCRSEKPFLKLRPAYSVQLFFS